MLEGAGRKLAGAIGAGVLGLGGGLFDDDQPTKTPPKAPKRRRGGGGKPSKGTSDIESLLSPESIPQRVAEGEVTPTILVTVTNFDITQENNVPITLSGLSGASAQQVVAMVRTEIGEILEEAVREGVEEVESLVSR